MSDLENIAEDLSNFLESLGVHKIFTIGIDHSSKMLNYFGDQQFELFHLQNENRDLLKMLSGGTDILPNSDLVILKKPNDLPIEATPLLLGILRNHANCPICFINHDQQISFNELISLGFMKQSDDLYTYDIATYNKKREWNNSRFWANPELFGKYWW